MCGVAVAGEVLAAREHARLVEAAREGERAARHGLGLGAERAIADDRVRRVRVHVEHRREVDVEAERAQLVAERAADLRGELARRRAAAKPSCARIGGHRVAGARTRCTSPPS